MTGEGANRGATATIKDKAGNTGTGSVTGVKIDRTKPVVSGAIVNDDGTARKAPTSKADIQCEGKNTASGTAIDKADNTTLATLEGIRIDSLAPVIEMTGLKASYTLGETTGISCTATDATSGVDANGCKVTTSGGTTNGVGTITYTATATDKAGNVATSTGTYKVLYAWNGFLQPINDTAHQVDQGVSVFKGGSTVPAEFQLKNAAGTVVQAGSAGWRTPSAGAATAAAISEDAYALTATTGGLYRYDATAQQYHDDWSTKGLKVGQYYRIGVTLDDGQTYSVSIGLR